MKAQLPNLELLEYQAKLYFKKHLNLNNSNLDIECLVFKQTWGSTNTAFDVNANNEPMFGGQSITDAYTTVFIENQTKTYVVFVDNKLCYVVSDATKEFLKDLKNHNLKCLRLSKKYY